jgi:hypothetical protein
VLCARSYGSALVSDGVGLGEAEPGGKGGSVCIEDWRGGKYRSTTPSPTRYPRDSSLWNTASRASSSSTVPVTPAPPIVPTALLASSDIREGFCDEEPCIHSSSRAARSFVMRYAMGTSSMSRKSRHEMFTCVAVGSGYSGFVAGWGAGADAMVVDECVAVRWSWRSWVVNVYVGVGELARCAIAPWKYVRTQAAELRGLWDCVGAQICLCGGIIASRAWFAWESSVY